MTRIAINGLGRIGRSLLKLLATRPGFDIVAVNDLGDLCSVYSWYDTGFGFTNTLAWHVTEVGARLRQTA